MTYQLFQSDKTKSDETNFENWVQSHPFGLVVNSSPGRLNPAYIKPHRPFCNSFRRHVWATTNYSKHCFDSASEAIEYFESRNFPKLVFGCGVCKVSALEPSTDAAQLLRKVDTLIDKGFTSAPPGNPAPTRMSTSTQTLFLRDPAVIAWVRAQANGYCELCSGTAPFQTPDDRPYLEVHHVKTLAIGGPDTVENTVALCPNCHRAMHYSKSREKLVDDIYRRVPRLSR